MLKSISIDSNILDLKQNIIKTKRELSEIGGPSPPNPELIDSANLLRSNEYLLRVDNKKTALVSIYEEYITTLESLMAEIFEIQKDLAKIIKNKPETRAKVRPRKKRTTRKSQKKKKLTKTLVKRKSSSRKLKSKRRR